MKTLLPLTALLAVTCVCDTQAANWPEYLHDSQRSARTTELLSTPLALQWIHTAAYPPKPAWPAPAKWDLFNKQPLGQAPGELYDRVFEVVAADGRLFYCSSADDAVHCLDAGSGKELWTFYTEAPLRVAPAIAGNRVIVSGDDGRVYAIDAGSGNLLWSTRPTPVDLRIAGNGRIMSLWPNRTGITVDGETVHVILGLFPLQQIHVVGLSLDDGNVVSTNLTDQPVQGYVQRQRDRLVATQGRKAEWVAAGLVPARIDLNVAPALTPIAPECRFVQVATTNLQIGGGTGKVVAFDTTATATGSVPRRVWEAAVDGEARSLAVSDGRLFVGTSAGKIYCFAAAKAAHVRANAQEKETRPAQEGRATGRILAELAAKNGILKGYALVTGSKGLLAEPLANAGLDVVYVVPDANAARRLRRIFASAGFAGRVSVHHIQAGEKLPYATWLFDLVAHEGLVTGEPPSANLEGELRRVLRPYGGIGFLGCKPEVTVRTGPLEGAGEWSHFYANFENNTCSGDTRITDTLRVQWFGEPGPERMVDRHNRSVAPICKDGRLFVCGNDYLYCVNAFNGRILWEKSIPCSVRPDATKECGNMSLAAGVLYIAAGADCLALDAITGKQLNVLAGRKGTEWGYVAALDGLLVGSSCGPGAHRRSFSQSSWEYSYNPLTPTVCSFDLSASDTKSGKRLWTYTPEKGVVINTTILIAGSRVFFVESLNPETIEVANSRVLLPQLVTNGTDLVALDIRSGKPLLRKTLDLSAVQHMLFMGHSKDVLLVTGVRTGTNIIHQLIALNAGDGALLWQKDHIATGTDKNGAHGELSMRPALVGDIVLAPPVKYELRTGNLVPGWTWERGGGGCGAISTCATHVFNRGSNPFMRNLKTGVSDRITAESRPGCWINIIPACGMVLIPEGSSGCHCAYQIQASFGFVPAQADSTGMRFLP